MHLQVVLTILDLLSCGSSNNVGVPGKGVSIVIAFLRSVLDIELKVCQLGNTAVFYCCSVSVFKCTSGLWSEH